MIRKRTILLLAVICLATLLLAAVPMASGSSRGSDGLCRVQGTWIKSTPLIPPYERPLIYQETLVPRDPDGRTLTYVARMVNPDETFLGLFPQADYMSELVGEAVRTGPNAYEFSLIGYGAKLATVPAVRDDVLYIWVIGGSIECIDNDTYRESGYVALFDGSQDADSDGFPDEGEEAILFLDSLPSPTAKRVP